MKPSSATYRQKAMNEDIEILLKEGNPNGDGLTQRALQKNKLLNSLLYIDNGEEVVDFIFCKRKYTERALSKKNKPILRSD